MDRPRSGRPRKSRTRDVIDAVRSRISRNPERSMRTMAKDFRMSERSMRRIVNDELQLISSRKCTGHVLTAEMKEQRLEKCRSNGRQGVRRILFTDEKVFSIEPI
uniref:HTH_Tnp_Tc3_2 domain-containing protein n=1 Tax=Steinernema glaseri TaxID=37863 RepID=A0A1I7Z6A3_9BILA